MLLSCHVRVTCHCHTMLMFASGIGKVTKILIGGGMGAEILDDTINRELFYLTWLKISSLHTVCLLGLVVDM